MSDSSESPLKIWRDKKLYLEKSLAIIADPAQKFALQQQIKECESNIFRLQSESKQNPSQTTTTVNANAASQTPNATQPSTTPINQVETKTMPQYKIAELTKIKFVQRVEQKLDRTEVKLVWFELFSSNLDDQLPSASPSDCIMQLYIRAEKHGILSKLYETLVELRPDLENP